MSDKYDIKNGVLVFASSTIPVPVFHGTTKYFLEFDSDFHKTELNDNYQGDWFCNSASREVGYKYSNANRNKNISKDLFFRELKDNVCSRFVDDEIGLSSLVYNLCKTAYENGSDSVWEVLDEASDNYADEGFHAKFFSETGKVLDVDSLLALVEFVEGSRYNIDDKSDGLDEIFDMLGASNSPLPSFIFSDMEALGFQDSIPYPRIICSYLKVNNFLETSSREEALDAKGKYDLVIYSGEGCVSDEPEFLVERSESMIVKYHIFYTQEVDDDTTTYHPNVITKKQLDKHFGKRNQERDLSLS